MLGALRLVALVLWPAPATAIRLAVTGAAGYLGAEIACLAASQGHQVRAAVKTGQPTSHLRGCDEVLEVDDLCDLDAARDVAEGVDAVVHTASVFRNVDDVETELVQPNILIAEQMVAACAVARSRLVLTSSMAAVRGTGQAPRGDCYSTNDWNTVSQRDGAGFEPYQYSKTESERNAWTLSEQFGTEMVTLCPSMIFGPPRAGCASHSVTMVQNWIDGKAPVQSRLGVDVRDCAQAHINAALVPHAAGKRYIVSCAARVPASVCADALKQSLVALGREAAAARISADENFDGGAVPIGAQEVAVSGDMEELGVTCRDAATSLSDMATALIEEPNEFVVRLRRLSRA